MTENGTILLVGAGAMAIEYYNVLSALNIPVVVVGRGTESAKNFENKTNKKIIVNGIENWIEKSTDIPKYAIISVTGTQLGNVTRLLLKYGVKNILLEKPGGLDKEDIKEVAKEAKKNIANVNLAYNRRFYASVIKAKEIIKEDGGVKSFTFEFTEWSHVIKDLKKEPGIKENWLLHNSSHVIDLAFYLGGEPDQIHCFTSGGLKWHPSGSIFTGAGITKKSALFSYHANWGSPGRWGIDILTKNSRLIFKPIEKLKIQKIGSVKTNDVIIDYTKDEELKPGLFRQVEAFLNSDYKEFIDIFQQTNRLKIYDKINGK